MHATNRDLTPPLFASRHFYHYAFWLTLFVSLFFDLLPLSGTLGTSAYLLVILSRLVTIAILTYFNLYVLMAGLYARNKKQAYWVSIFVTLVVFAGLSMVVNHLLVTQLNYPLSGLGWKQDLLIYFFVGARLLFLSFLLQLSVDYYDQRKKIDALQIARLQAEVNFIKAQVNPHFLFNTLNNLYSLVLAQSEKAAGLVMNLADIMDYHLQSTTKNQVSLDKELAYIHTYLEVEKVRYEEPEGISFTLQGETLDLKIIPLLLMPLVENAMKHGISQITQKPWLQIEAHVDHKTLAFTVINNLPTTSTDKVPNHGIGLENIRQRLSLFYPQQHQFRAEAKGGFFTLFCKQIWYEVLLRIG